MSESLLRFVIFEIGTRRLPDPSGMISPGAGPGVTLQSRTTGDRCDTGPDIHCLTGKAFLGGTVLKGGKMTSEEPDDDIAALGAVEWLALGMAGICLLVAIGISFA